LEIEGEGGATTGGHRHLFRYAAVCYGIGVRDSWNRIEGSCEFRTEFCGSVLAGCQGHRVGVTAFYEAEDVPAGVDVVERGGDTAVDELDAENIFEGAAEGPAKGIRRVVGHQIAVAAIHGHSDGTLFSGSAGRVRE